MTLAEFIARHDLKEIDQRDQWVPMDLCPEDDDGEEMRFHMNDDRTVGIAVDLTRKRVRIAYAELVPVVSEWIPLAEDFECPALG